MTDSCTVLEGRAHFGDLVLRAQAGQATIITRYGKPAAALVAAAWYRQAAANEVTIEPLTGTIRLTVTVNSDLAFNLLKEAYRRTGRPEGGEDAGRERLEAIKSITADALAKYLDSHETAETKGEQQ